MQPVDNRTLLKMAVSRIDTARATLINEARTPEDLFDIMLDLEKAYEFVQRVRERKKIARGDRVMIVRQ